MTPSIAFDAVITVNGTINGDLFTFGQSVSVCPDASITRTFSALGVTSEIRAR